MFLHTECNEGRLHDRLAHGQAPRLDALSYWTFSDVFEENSIPKSEFHDKELAHQPHYGAMTLHGVPKPVWRCERPALSHARLAPSW